MCVQQEFLAYTKKEHCQFKDTKVAYPQGQSVVSVNSDPTSLR